MKYLKRIIFVIMLHALSFALAEEKLPQKKVKIERSNTKEKSILCDSTKSQLIRIGFGRITILNFPLVPKEVLPGEQVFDFRQIKNDLAIKALRPQANTNVAIYLADRRCSFELITVVGRGDDILFVHDPKDARIEVKIRE